MEGTSLYEVKEFLGHSTIQVTERYAHLAPDLNKKAANKIQSLFDKSEEKTVISTRLFKEVYWRNMILVERHGRATRLSKKVGYSKA